ncbi:hypothetical protein BZA77DRAFT_297946 [Pyronema omphalodes]|nr:hypothetical protein BZA77DRAFT_297946 [Pyronema omphalodes]
MNRGGARHLNVHAAIFTPASVIETNDSATPAIPASHAKLSPTAAAFIPHLQYREMSDLIDKLPPALKPRDPDISSLLKLEVLGTLHDVDVYLLRDAGSILFCEGDRPQQFYGSHACLVLNHRQGSRYTLRTDGTMSKDLLISLGRDIVKTIPLIERWRRYCHESRWRTEKVVGEDRCGVFLAATDDGGLPNWIDEADYSGYDTDYDSEEFADIQHTAFEHIIARPTAPISAPQTPIREQSVDRPLCLDKAFPLFPLSRPIILLAHLVKSFFLFLFSFF